MYPYYAPPPPRATVSDMMSGTFRVWSKNFVNFFTVYIVLALATGVFQAVVGLAILGSFVAGGGFLPGSSAPLAAGPTAIILFAIASLFLSVILTSIVTGGMTEYAVRRFRGESMTLQDALQRGVKRFPSILGATLLLYLIVFGLVLSPILLFFPVVASGAGDPSRVIGALCALLLGLVVGSVVALWLYVSLSLYAPAIMMEGATAFGGLSRSWWITQGHRWSLFGAILLTQLILLAITALIVSPTTLARNPIATIAAGAIASGIGGPWLVILSAVAYDLILRGPTAMFGVPPPYAPPSYPYMPPYASPSPPMPSPPPSSPPQNP